MRTPLCQSAFLTALLSLFLAPPAPAVAQACTGPGEAAQRLYATDLLDSGLFGAHPEDAGFFSQTRGKPNVYFLLDNSGSMQRTPPNGPSFYAGSYAEWKPTTYSDRDRRWTIGTLPPLKDGSACDSRSDGDAADPGCDYRDLRNPNLDAQGLFTSWGKRYVSDMNPVIGCGDDDISKEFAGDGTLIKWLRDRQYNPPCGDPAITSAKKPYDSAEDYAEEASRCPRYDGSLTGGSGANGYDPDFYCGTGTTCADGTPTNCSGTCARSRANFFDKVQVFHDNIYFAPINGPANGWNWDSANPGGATVAAFCDAQFTSTVKQGSVLKRDICKDCLNTRGFFLDGWLYRMKQESLDVDGNGGRYFAMPYPSIWLKGNWLNFYPPKHVIARKVLKDLLMKQRDVRIGFRTFSTTRDPTPTCAALDTPFDPFDSIKFLNEVAFNTGTPTPSKMLEIGQSFHSRNTQWFETAAAWGDFGTDVADPAICYDCQKTSLILVTDGLPSPGQTGKDGDVEADDLTRDAGDVTTGTNSIGTDVCTRCDAVTEVKKKSVIQIAWYLHNLDLRKDDEDGVDCQKMSSKQVMDVHTLGFATDTLPEAGTMLSAAAEMGGGTYTSAEDPTELSDALTSIMARVSNRATTFSVAAVSTLQSAAGQSVIVPRFAPQATDRTLFYPGHLFRFDLKSEFTSGCRANADGTVTGDLDCDGKCSSVFLVDREGKMIAEDVTGRYFQLSPNAPACTAARHCTSGCGNLSDAEAKPFWDAGASLQHPAPSEPTTPSTPSGPPDRRWSSRPVYTIVDNTNDGAIDAKDTVFLLRTDDATAAKLLPYLNLGGTSTTCAAIASQLLTAGDATEAAAVLGANRLECARTIIRYVLGADVFNSRDFSATGPTGEQWPVTNQGDLADRLDKLGDIFHSSPVVVDAPLPPDGILCQRGLHNQCITSLWKTPIEHEATNGNAYGDYAKAYKNRRKLVLVGSNDGLVHAFNGGSWNANRDDPELAARTPPIRTSGAPFFGYYDRGDGSEIWAFLAPDLLPKIGFLLRGDVGHQIYVDGTPMVRDVWVDGSSNGMSTADDADDRKQAREFHTVAVFGERRGGTHFFALDVTNASHPIESASHVAPKFLWVYPQPSSKEAFDFGETYSEFLPTPPPIGPVRIKADETSGPAETHTPKFGVTAYHEKWIVALNGGFDPSYQRGRGVHLVDVWSGEEVFDFSKPAGASFTAGDPRNGLDYPVAAPVGLVAWGTDTNLLAAGFVNDGYFDTATFGDAGGQLWVLRFSAPGELNATTKLAGNWHGARVFQMGGRGATSIAKGLPFFYITANVNLKANGAYRVLAGTGDRYNLLDTQGGVCKPSNIRACLQAGCLLNDASTPPPTLGVATAGLGGSTYTTSVTAAGGDPTRTSASVAAGSGCAVTGSLSIKVASCSTTRLTGSSTSLAGTLDSTGLALQCSKDASNVYGCAPASLAPAAEIPLRLKTGQTNPNALHNWFVSLRVFEPSGDRGIFSTADEAADYDGARLYLDEANAEDTAPSGLVVIDGTLATEPTTLSSATELGYALKLAHDDDVVLSPKTYSVNEYDERTSTPTAVVSGCAFWSTTQPTVKETDSANSGTCSGTRPLSYCAAASRRINYFYGADTSTGGRCLTNSSGTLVRNTTSATLVPPPAPQFTVFVNEKGQVAFGLTSVNSETGAQNISQGEISDPASLLEFLPVDRTLHDCRHSGVCP